MAGRTRFVNSGRPVWGCLKRLGASADRYGEDVFYLTKDSITIGRSGSCDVCLRYSGISRRHLVIGLRHSSSDEDVTAFIEDVSSNGTIVRNGGKSFLLKRQAAKLENGDELILAKAGGSVVGFKFLRYRDVEEMLFVNNLPSNASITVKRPVADASTSEAALPPGSKRIKRERTDTEDDEVLVDDILVRTSEPSTSRVPEVVTLDDDEIIFELQRNLESGGLEEKLRKQMAAETGERSNFSSDPSTPSTSKNDGVAASAINSIAETLACSICMELLHDPVTSATCLHSSCGGCLSQWIFQVSDPSSPQPSYSLRNQCPKCRARVTTVVRNTELSSVVADVLKVNSHQKRPDSDLAELDKANKFVGELSFDVYELYRKISSQTARSASGRSTRRGRSPRRGARSQRRGAAAFLPYFEAFLHFP